MKTKKMVIGALFAALVCVSTFAVRIPAGLSGGYVNMGDAVVLLAGYLLGPVLGGLAGGIGSALADAFGGYMAFAVPTLVIKFLMAFVSAKLFGSVFKKRSWAGLIVCGIMAECIMTVGYFLFEIVLTGSVFAAAAGIWGNITQALFGIFVSTVAYKLLSTKKEIMKFFK